MNSQDLLGKAVEKYMHTAHHVNPLVKNKDLFVPFIQINLSRSSLTCFNASIRCVFWFDLALKLIHPQPQKSVQLSQ